MIKKAYKAGTASVFTAAQLGYAWYNRYKQKQEAKKSCI
jgi:hypothetical protein